MHNIEDWLAKRSQSELSGDFSTAVRWARLILGGHRNSAAEGGDSGEQDWLPGAKRGVIVKCCGSTEHDQGFFHSFPRSALRVCASPLEGVEFELSGDFLTGQ